MTAAMSRPLLSATSPCFWEEGEKHDGKSREVIDSSREGFVKGAGMMQHNVEIWPVFRSLSLLQGRSPALFAMEEINLDKSSDIHLAICLQLLPWIHTHKKKNYQANFLTGTK